ncbi:MULTISPECIES: hypothetical protein [unclassified Ruegeria]|uniref:hypothetical protein n=1 Tax=unclassified Ruegeria TaxID=2625375 RepID=UPI001AE5E778|nr:MULTISPECIES: hypothetical protein [unclassified Ruegeria]
MGEKRPPWGAGPALPGGTRRAVSFAFSLALCLWVPTVGLAEQNNPLKAVLDVCASDGSTFEETVAEIYANGWIKVSPDNRSSATGAIADAHLFSGKIASENEWPRLRFEERSQVGSRVNRVDSRYFQSATLSSQDKSSYVNVFFEERRKRLDCMASTTNTNGLDDLTYSIADRSSSGRLGELSVEWVAHSDTSEHPDVRATLYLVKPHVQDSFKADPLLAPAGLTVLRYLD